MPRWCSVMPSDTLWPSIARIILNLKSMLSWHAHMIEHASEYASHFAPFSKRSLIACQAIREPVVRCRCEWLAAADAVRLMRVSREGQGGIPGAHAITCCRCACIMDTINRMQPKCVRYRWLLGVISGHGSGQHTLFILPHCCQQAC